MLWVRVLGGGPLIPRLRHFDDCGAARIVTFKCYRNLPLLSNLSAMNILSSELAIARTKHAFKLLGYVFMPEHVHLVMHPPDGMKLGLVIREIKSRTAIKYFRRFPTARRTDRHVFWLPRCYDHNCRNEEVVREKVRYCHDNPVRRGLVAKPGDWLWSSHNWYQGMRPVPLEMDDWP